MSIFQFLLTYDFRRNRNQIVCDLIYVHNTYRLEPARVKFGMPFELDQRPDIHDDPNTYMPAKVDPNMDHRMKPNETGFMYRRLPLACLRRNPDYQIIPPQLPFTTHEVLDQINRQLSVSLIPEDLVNMTYQGNEKEFIIQATPESYVWLGFRDIDVGDGSNKKILFREDKLNPFPYIFSGTESPLQALTDEGNSYYDTNWLKDVDFRFGALESIPKLETEIGQNTRIYVESLLPNYEHQWLYYRRLNPQDITSLFDENTPCILVLNPEITTDILLDYLYDVFGVYIGTDDVYFDDYETAENLNMLTLRFRNDSYVWLPGSIQIPICYGITSPYVRLSEEGVVRSPGPDQYRVYRPEVDVS